MYFSKNGWVFFHLFQILSHIIFKGQTMTKWKRRPSNMVKREEREKSDHKGQRVLRELYQPKKYIECIFKWDHYFLFPIWSHINLKRSNQDGHEKRRPFNMVKKEEKERRMTNKGQIVLRELYQPKYIECIFKWVSIFPFQIWSHINFKGQTMTKRNKKRPSNMV